MFDLTGKVALVTGGNGGIGLGMAAGLAQFGATVVLAGRNTEKSAQAAADLADQFLVCIEGSIVLARIHGDPAYLRRGLEQFRRCLDKAEGRAA